ncbi:MAG: orotidine 5'-phosphate decarboxylase, partial [Hyphomonadaceae bacterium]
MSPFADRLMDRVRAHGPLCVGIDPHPALLPGLFGAGPEAAARWGMALVERVGKLGNVLSAFLAQFYDDREP